MSQIQYTTILEWEKRLEIEAEKQKSRRSINVFGDYQPGPTEHKSIFARIFGRARASRESIYPCCAQEHTHQPQPG